MSSSTPPTTTKNTPLYTSLFFFSLSSISLPPSFHAEKQVWSFLEDGAGFSIIFGVIRNGIRRIEEEGVMREKGRQSWEQKRTWALAEQSCLWQAKWRSNSILAMTKGQVPLLKACLHQMQTQHLFFFSFFFFFFLNPFLPFNPRRRHQKGMDFHPSSVLHLIFFCLF